MTEGHHYFLLCNQKSKRAPQRLRHLAAAAMVKICKVDGHPFYQTQGRGEGGALQECIDKAGDDEFFVALQQSNVGYSFASFKNHAVFYEWMTIRYTGPRCFAQINRSVQLPTHSSSFYADVEWNSADTDFTSRDRLHLIKEAIRQLIPEGEIVVEDLTRRDRGTNYVRNSFHLYIPSARYSDSYALKDLVVNRLWPSIQHIDQMSHDGKPILDMKVYTSNRFFRLPGSSKFKAYRELKIPDFEFFDSCIISRPLPANIDYVFVEEPTASMKRKHTGGAPARVPLPVEKLAEYAKIKELLVAKGDPHTDVVWDGNRYVGVTSREHGRVCLVGDEKCESNNCVLFVRPNGDVYYHCHGASAHSYFKGVMIGNVSPDRVRWDVRGPDVVFTGHHEEESQWDPSVKRFTHTDDLVQPIEPLPTTQVYCIRAEMSMGKTHQCKILVADYVAQKKRVAIISPRVAFASSQLGLYGPEFSHYKEKNFRADRLIIQYESLYHLQEDGGCGRFDLVIIDEIRSIISNVTSIKTNGDHLRENANVLRTLITGSELCVCLDANLEFDASVPVFLQSCVPTSAIEVHNYTHRKMVRELQLTTDHTGWLAAVKADLAAGKKVSLICRTKKNALTYADMFKDYNPAVFTRDTPDLQMVCFEDVNTYLADKQLFIFTSKITVGADIQVPWHTVAVDFRDNGCLGRDILQMIGRFRNLLSTTISVMVEKADCRFYNNLHELARAYFSDRKRLAHKYIKLLNSDCTFDGGRRLKWAPDWLSQLFMLRDVETKQCQRYTLYHQAVQKGWTVSYRSSTYAVDPEFKDAKLRVGELGEQATQAAFARASETVDLPAEIDRVKQRVNAQESTKEDKDFLCVAHTVKHYRRQLEYKDLAFAEKNKEQIQRYALLASSALGASAAQIIIRKEVTNLENAPFIDLNCKMLLVQTNSLQIALNVFGIKSPMERLGDLLPMETFVQHEDRIVAQCLECTVAGRRRVRASKKKELPGDRAVATLRAELWNVWGMTLTAKRRGKQTKETLGYVIDKDPDVARLAALSDFVKPYLELRARLEKEDALKAPAAGNPKDPDYWNKTFVTF